MTFQVVARFTVGGNAWTEAMARVIFIWQGIIGAAYVIGRTTTWPSTSWSVKLPAFVVKIFEVLAHSIVGSLRDLGNDLGWVSLASSAMDQTVELLPFKQGMLYS